MVLEPCPQNLFAVVEILGPDEPDDRVDDQRLIVPRDGVRARLARLLVDAVVGVGRERRALARLEVHDIVADCAAPERECRIARLGEQ